MPRRNRRSKEVKRRDDLVMDLGDTQPRMVGQTAFVKDAGGGPCGNCSTVWATLFADGLGPCCHTTVQGGVDDLGAGKITMHRHR
jgi:hypothetical protein